MTEASPARWYNGAPVRIIFPVVLTVALFVLTIFLLFLPMLEERMMAGKRETIRELTETAWSALADYERAVQGGRMSRTEAEARAIDHLRALRYGPEAKDYFWINDMQPQNGDASLSFANWKVGRPFEFCRCQWCACVF